MVSKHTFYNADIECPNCKSIVRKNGFSKHKKSKKCIKATNTKKVAVAEKEEIQPKVCKEVVVERSMNVEPKEIDSIVKTGDKKYQITLNITENEIIEFLKVSTGHSTKTTTIKCNLFNLIYNSKRMGEIVRQIENEIICI